MRILEMFLVENEFERIKNLCILNKMFSNFFYLHNQEEITKQAFVFYINNN